MRRSTLVIVVVCLAAILLGCIEQDGEMVKPAETELVLSDYPELFGKDVIIVIGENATQMEYGSAEAIAENLHKRTWNIPVIKGDTWLTEDDKAKYNLILVGGPRSNSVVQELYVTDKTIQARVTNDWPGPNKGVVEILTSPWNAEKYVLIAAGWDEYGTKAAANKLEQIHTIDKTSIIVEYIAPSDLTSYPDLMYPPNGTTTDDRTIMFGWYVIEDAQKYLLQVDNNSDFSSPEIETYTVEPQFAPKVPLSDDTYHWRVKVIDKANKESDWSDAWKITIFTASNPKTLKNQYNHVVGICTEKNHGLKNPRCTEICPFGTVVSASALKKAR